jgi:hypothetical protein
MSTLKVDGIRSNSASSDAITLASDGTCTANITNNLSNRNVVINGEFQAAQRATSTASITSGGYYTCDRWYTTITTAGTWTQSQSTDVPAGTTFRSSLKMDCTTADSSLAAGDRLMLSYRLEGQDVQRFGKGTTSPKKFALSFWVKSPKTGTHIVELFDHDNSRHICKAYTIASANTWEQQKLIIDNETSNAFGNDNGKSLEIQFYLAAGTTYTSGTLATAWAANTNANRAVGQVNVADNTSNDFYLCGVQLEASDVCTSFEHRSYGQELQLCKRYYYDITSDNAAYSKLIIHQNGYFQHPLQRHPVEMRAAPTITFSNVARRALNAGSDTSESISNTTSGKTSWTSYVTNTSNTFHTFIYDYPIKFDAEL